MPKGSNRPQMASEEDLASLHSAVVDALMLRIRDGSASAADLAVAAKLLRDNGMVRDLPPEPPRPDPYAFPGTDADQDEDFDTIAARFQQSDTPQ